MKLSVKEDKVYFSYEGVEYRITDHPYDPCTYLMKDDDHFRSLRNGFTKQEVKTMVELGVSQKSARRHFIREEQLRHIFAAAVESGVRVQYFDDAEDDAAKRYPCSTIVATRDSVGMGDDCGAPHETELLFYEDTMLSDFMSEISWYVPHMTKGTWVVKAGQAGGIQGLRSYRPLANVTFDEQDRCHSELLVPDALISSLHISHVFCDYQA